MEYYIAIKTKSVDQDCWLGNINLEEQTTKICVSYLIFLC